MRFHAQTPELPHARQNVMWLIPRDGTTLLNSLVATSPTVGRQHTRVHRPTVFEYWPAGNGMSSRVEPVVLATDAAKEQLETNGMVYWFSQSDRSTGRTQYRDTHSGADQGKVEITSPTGVILPTVSSLNVYQSFSGFSSVQSWLDAIERVHGDLSAGYIYCVRLLNQDE